SGWYHRDSTNRSISMRFCRCESGFGVRTLLGSLSLVRRPRVVAIKGLRDVVAQDRDTDGNQRKKQDDKAGFEGGSHGESWCPVEMMRKEIPMYFALQQLCQDKSDTFSQGK